MASTRAASSSRRPGGPERQRERSGDEVLGAADGRDKSLPIFMAHGSFDPMLPMALGKDSAALLTQSGFRVEWHEYPMAHAVCAEEIVAIRRWLLGVFGRAE